MDSPFAVVELGQISVQFKPKPNLRKKLPAHESLQFFFQISNARLHRGIMHAIDGQEHPLVPNHKTGPTTDHRRMDSRSFERATEGMLSSCFEASLTVIGVVSGHRAEVVSRIVEGVDRMMRSVNRRRKVMVVHVEIESELIHRMFESETERAIWESVIGSCGMVAADLKAAKRMMRSVRIGGERKRRRLDNGGEEAQRECRICLEEMKDLGMGLPCLHLFHSNCILKWLQTSHYCPLCRFEMPT